MTAGKDPGRAKQSQTMLMAVSGEMTKPGALAAATACNPGELCPRRGDNLKAIQAVYRLNSLIIRTSAIRSGDAGRYYKAASGYCGCLL